MSPNGNRPAGNGAVLQTVTTPSKSDPIASHQVSWLTVHRFVTPVLNQVDEWPLLGAPAWCSLSSNDPRKWAALLDGAQHWALRLDSLQADSVQDSHDISAAVDWSAVARAKLQRAHAIKSGAYIPRRYPS